MCDAEEGGSHDECRVSLCVCYKYQTSESVYLCRVNRKSAGAGSQKLEEVFFAVAGFVIIIINE